MFNDFPEQQAICAFFLDFVLLPRHPDSAQGHLEHLLPLYANTSAESPLSLATSSVALMISGGSPTRRSDQQLGRTIFGKALQKTSAAIRNPAESRKDETLMAVLLLGLFEVRYFTVWVRMRCIVSWLSFRSRIAVCSGFWPLIKACCEMAHVLRDYDLLLLVSAQSVSGMTGSLDYGHTFAQARPNRTMSISCLNANAHHESCSLPTDSCIGRCIG